MTNPLLEELYDDEVIQTTELALPTLGRFYEEGVLHPDADPTAIEVSPVGIVAELRLNDPFMLASGRATPKIIKAVAPMVLKPEILCSIDMNAILLASRIVSHGPKLEIDVKCQNPEKKGKEPVCVHEDKLSVDLMELIMRYAPITDEDMERLVFVLPKTGQTVCIQPPTYGNAMEALKAAVNADRSYEEIKAKPGLELINDRDTADQYEQLIDLTAQTSMATLVDQIFYVESRKGEKYLDKSVILNWIERIPPEDVKEIQTRMAEMGRALIDLNMIKYQCSNCGHENSVYISLDPQQLFFYDSQASTPPKQSSTSTGKRQSGGKRRSRTSQR